MPFMLGKAPVRRTLDYLKNCKIFLRENVRIFTISYSLIDKHHIGAKEFVFWNIPQLQFNNPTVQFVKLKNFTPTPFIKVYFEDREPIVIDLDSRSKDEINKHLENLSIISKTEAEIKMEDKDTVNKTNPSYFGSGCGRHCLCEVYGQVPCPGIVPVPKHWTGINKERILEIPPHFKKWGMEMKEKEFCTENV